MKHELFETVNDVAYLGRGRDPTKTEMKRGKKGCISTVPACLPLGPVLTNPCTQYFAAQANPIIG